MKRWVNGRLKTDQLLTFVFGVIFLSVLLAVAIIDPTLTDNREIIRIILALAAAGVGAMFPGFLDIRGNFPNLVIRATGALALFVLIYLIRPGG